ncbi:MAG: tRNA 5-methoxyuridine(34)/uridine 5-oxyacetic acid(34) synthase CmoB [Gammaproteobacteria bacterium]
MSTTELAAWFAPERERLAIALAGLPASARAWWRDMQPRMDAACQHEGHAARLVAALAALPALKATRCVAGAVLRVEGACAPATRADLRSALLALAPWRKGPLEFFGVCLDAEWRSDLKWARVAPHLAPLAGRRVLDVGCGNGYYAWRMAAAGAALVVGIDPALPALAQGLALRRYWQGPAPCLLPLASDALDARLACFDTVFSMGVLYHRRDALAHLAELAAALKPGGELLLETLVLAEGGAAVLEPGERYCAMRNVFQVPAPRTVLAWLAARGFADARLVDVTATSTVEQRRTAWMPRHSLPEFLDPRDARRTREGHPAPLRAVFVARRGAGPL